MWISQQRLFLHANIALIAKTQLSCLQSDPGKSWVKNLLWALCKAHSVSIVNIWFLIVWSLCFRHWAQLTFFKETFSFFSHKKIGFVLLNLFRHRRGFCKVMFGARINIFIRWQQTKEVTSMSECFTAKAYCWNAVQILWRLQLCYILKTLNSTNSFNY